MQKSSLHVPPPILLIPPNPGPSIPIPLNQKDKQHLVHPNGFFESQRESKSQKHTTQGLLCQVCHFSKHMISNFKILKPALYNLKMKNMDLPPGPMLPIPPPMLSCVALMGCPPGPSPIPIPPRPPSKTTKKSMIRRETFLCITDTTASKSITKLFQNIDHHLLSARTRKQCTHEVTVSFCCPQHGSLHEELICHPDKKQGCYAMIF